MTERETLAEIVESYRNGLLSRATGGTMDREEYDSARKTIIGAPQLAGLVPRFIKTCRTADEFAQFIKSEFPTYAERRRFIADQISPMLDHLDQAQTNTTTDLAVGERVGSGGFGTVFKARHSVLNMDFAIKVFEPSFDDGNRPDLDRFFREARILFKLHHPNIVRIYDAGFIGGKPFIRMEYFEGRNVNEHLKTRGVLSAPDALHLIQNVASALSHAHGMGIVHRDIKPSNIMINDAGDARVVDFGLGAFVEADLVSRITKTGDRAVGGYYTAPELLENPARLDPSSDVYSIGALWYTTLTGKAPAGTDVQERIEELRAVEPRVAVMRRALAAQGNRYATASELYAALLELPVVASVPAAAAAQQAVAADRAGSGLG